MNHELWTASCILLALGALAFIAGSIWKTILAGQDEYEEHVEARVVDIINQPNTKNAVQAQFCNAQIAIFEYYANGKLIKVKDRTETYPCPYQLNQRVKLCFHPETPEEYAFEKKDPRKTYAFLIETTGTVLIILGCLLFFRYISR